ncbi:MAG: hypothetical protein M1828_006598 [Chrysothrix sp. TS-e1954]|nr:MAG: hypothetical protein M1828_006598 [Chrysothrix sp. TS-e1954]
MTHEQADWTRISGFCHGADRSFGQWASLKLGCFETLNDHAVAVLSAIYEHFEADMRASRRLLTTTRDVSTSFNDGVVRTGLTGLLSHPYPRPHLLSVYNDTLDKLAKFPETSVYRQSVEALTKHRRNLVQSTKPQGYDEWKQRAAAQIEKNPRLLEKRGSQGDIMKQLERGYRYHYSTTVDERVAEWDEDDVVEARMEGPLEEEMRANQAMEFGAGREPEASRPEDRPRLEKEPQLSSEQINDLEGKLNSGLIEEVVVVAERELALVDTMRENEVWEELCEKPPEGQWQYFQRDYGTGSTQIA